ncbi:MAG: hypothetical protein HZC28_16095 [Spirochaetes bacterium]|nr:hypothetical protein [Spirochaetota bacterium]
MYIFASAVAFVFILVLGYFLLDNATKSKYEAMKVFGAVLFSLLAIIAIVTLFSGIWLTLSGAENYFYQFQPRR